MYRVVIVTNRTGRPLPEVFRKLKKGPKQKDKQKAVDHASRLRSMFDADPGEPQGLRVPLRVRFVVEESSADVVGGWSRVLEF